MDTINKTELKDRGIELAHSFCQANGMNTPVMEIFEKELTPLSACAWYRKDKITIYIKSCAHIGTTGMAWSYPGYIIDRTPYGVIQHELGHHFDYYLGKSKGPYYSEFSRDARLVSSEDKITNYCPNDAEWFAEMFRLYVTNPDLLKNIRPETYGFLYARLKPVITKSWRDVLTGAPERTLAQCLKRGAK